MSWHRLSAREPGPPPQGVHQRWLDVPSYRPSRDLVEVMEAAIALRQPVLLTGEPGCGKTTAAYWAAWRLGLGPERLFHVQVRSDATAAALKYEFDAVRYLREAVAAEADWEASRRRYLRPGPLWRAFEAATTGPTVLLFDEIDKAPRDLPNDLLDEFDAWAFDVPDVLDVSGRPLTVSARGGVDDGVTLVMFTSNAERQLPSAFLRRCVHHHLEIDIALLREVVAARVASGQLTLAEGLVEHAIARLVAIRATYGLKHRPGTSELLVWLRMLALAGGVSAQELEAMPLHTLPFLGALIKDHADRELLSRAAQ